MKKVLPGGYSARLLPGHYSFLLEEDTQRKNYYTFRKEWGNGFVFFRELEPGFCVALWKGTLRLPLAFQFLPAQMNQEEMISLLFPVESSSIILNKLLNGLSVSPSHGKILLINNTYEYTSHTEANGSFEILEIFLRNEWIKDQYAHDDTGMCDICGELSRKEPIQTIKVDSLLYFHSILSGIIHEIMKGHGNGLQLKFRTLELLDFSLHQLHPDISRERETDDFLIRMKQIISNHLDGKLPAIPVLAKELATSESSLKRKFRKSFGTSIYEYYTAQKMERAKSLLAEKGLQVTEVAYQLSYEKVSHFIEVFKKYFGDSPGRFKKADTEN